MTRDGSNPDRAPGDPALDFIAYLALLWGIEKQAAREMLGLWMATYEPVKAHGVTKGLARPSASGVFRCPGTDDAGHAGKVGAA